MCMISLDSKRHMSLCFHEGKHGITLSWSVGCWFSQRGSRPGALEPGQWRCLLPSLGPETSPSLQRRRGPWGWETKLFRCRRDAVWSCDKNRPNSWCLLWQSSHLTFLRGRSGLSQGKPDQNRLEVSAETKILILWKAGLLVPQYWIQNILVWGNS